MGVKGFCGSPSLRVYALRGPWATGTEGRLHQRHVWAPLSGGLPCGAAFWKAVKFVTKPPAELQVWLKRSSRRP